MKKKTASWVAISLWLYFFFPVGIYLLVKKVTTEKNRYTPNGKALQNLGIVLLCFTFLSVIMAFSGQVEYGEDNNPVTTAIMLLLIFGGSSALAFYKGHQYIMRGQRYSECISRLSVQHVMDIDPIAIDLKIPFNVVATDFQEMINIGYLKNMQVDLDNRRLVVQRPVRPTYTVTCPHCGGKSNIEVGAAAKCEYCDSPLTV